MIDEITNLDGRFDVAKRSLFNAKAMWYQKGYRQASIVWDGVNKLFYTIRNALKNNGICTLIIVQLLYKVISNNVYSYPVSYHLCNIHISLIRYESSALHSAWIIQQCALECALCCDFSIMIALSSQTATVAHINIFVAFMLRADVINRLTHCCLNVLLIWRSVIVFFSKSENARLI